MPSPAQLPPDPKARVKIRWGERIAFAVIVLVMLACIAAWGISLFGYRIAKDYAESPAGRRAAGRALGHAIKVDGDFAPLHIDDWKIRTDSFTSKGWPGEAIGSLDAQGIEAEFDPGAVVDGAWRIKYVNIAHATINLRKPDDALKRPVPPKKPRPWFAFLLPTRVECGPIISPNAELLYSFQGRLARIHDAQVQADLIGKDLKYTATSGILEMPYLPPLRIQRLEMLVTKPFIRVYSAQLVGIDPQDTTRVTLSGTIGMRDNKEIAATGEVVDLPIEQILPEDLQPLVHGRATGKLTWKRDVTGKILDSDGELSLNGASIDNLSVFRQLALLHGNADLTNFAFDEAACEFHLHNGHVVLEVRAHAPNKMTLVGKVDYQFDSKKAVVDLAVTELPLQTWLPTEFKPGAAGFAQAHLQWQGELKTIKDSSGHVTLNLDGGTLATPAILRQLLAKKKLRAPNVIKFKTAELDLVYQGKTFQLTRANLDLPGILNAQVDGALLPGDLLNANVAWQGLTIEDWLPTNLADEFSGDIQGQAKMEVRQWKLGDGSYAGQIRLVSGQLRYTPFQSLLARFVNDRKLLDLPLTRAAFDWTWRNGRLSVSQLDLRAGDRLGVEGAFTVGADKKISGTLWVGTKPDYLKSLSGLGEKVFPQKREGLRWAKVQVSGTTKKPEQDLGTQIVAALHRQPTAIFGLGLKGISWYVGNWFGADKDWQRPKGR